MPVVFSVRSSRRNDGRVLVLADVTFGGDFTLEDEVPVGADFPARQSASRGAGRMRVEVSRMRKPQTSSQRTVMIKSPSGRRRTSAPSHAGSFAGSDECGQSQRALALLATHPRACIRRDDVSALREDVEGPRDYGERQRRSEELRGAHALDRLRWLRHENSPPRRRLAVPRDRQMTSAGLRRRSHHRASVRLRHRRMMECHHEAIRFVA